MKITCLPKDYFDDLMKSKKITDQNVNLRSECFISINDSCETDQKPYFKNNENVLVLFFDDIDKDLFVRKAEDGSEIWHRAFTQQQAEQVIEFINRNRNKTTCVIHCTAGVRRSGTIAEFINRYLNLAWPEFREANRHIQIRQSIKDTLQSCIQKDSGLIK